MIKHNLVKPHSWANDIKAYRPLKLDLDEIKKEVEKVIEEYRQSRKDNQSTN